jgi:hypothetical protein
VSLAIQLEARALLPVVGRVLLAVMAIGHANTSLVKCAWTVAAMGNLLALRQKSLPSCIAALVVLLRASPLDSMEQLGALLTHAMESFLANLLDSREL